MKCLLFLTMITTIFAHEGHHHAEGMGAVVTTAVVTGSEGHEFVTVPGWGKVPDDVKLGSLHGDLTLDKAGNLYVATTAGAGVVVFDRFGNCTKTLKKGLSGMHSLTTVMEGEQEFIWGAQVKQNRAVKFDLEGNVISTLPNEKTGELEGGMGGLTELLVGPDGHLFLFMGYGSKKIHKLKPDGSLVKSYGGKGKGKGQFMSCHGAAIDLRYDEPRILVCDRDGRRMIHLTMDLDWIGIYGEALMRRPADVDVQGDLAAVAELEGRVILMDKKGKIVSALCDNSNEKQWATNRVPAEELHDAAFSAPHGIKWGSHGQIFVTEYSTAGRLVALYPKK